MLISLDLVYVNSDLQSVAATKIQAWWRGHWVRTQVWGTNWQVRGQGLDTVDRQILQELHRAATKIQVRIKTNKNKTGK